MSDASSGPSVRVLMMVDNTVEGDSRVQKAARSMADAGYAVTLLGRTPDGAAEDGWEVGRAAVRRVPVRFTRYEAQRRRHRRIRQAVEAPLALVRRLRGGPSPLSSTGTPAAPAAAYAPRRGRRLDDLRARFWHRLAGNRSWTRLEPRLLDYDAAFGPVADALRPAVLHAHDYKMIGVAVRSAERLRARGHDVRVVYDAHEYLPGVGGPSLRWETAHQAYEADHIHRCDAVVAVSDEMAARIRDHHHLPVTPTVVMNAPPMATAGAGGSGDLRTVLGLAADVPVLVYVGVSAAKRGLLTVVHGLPRLAGVHLALVTTRNPYVEQLEKTAAELGVADRLHVLPYVPVDDVVPFVSSATAGLQSMVHVENYDVTIATKFFDYAQARLPIVQSDVRAMAALTRSIGCGEVYVAEDVDSFVSAASTVLAEPGRYRAAYDRPGLLEAWTWEAQAGVLAELYRRLLAAPAGTPVEPVPTVGR